MSARGAIGSVFKLAVLCGIAYVLFNWKTISPGGSDVEAFAKDACVSAAKARYDLSRANAYDISRNSNGYVVRISATLSTWPTTCSAVALRLHVRNPPAAATSPSVMLMATG